MPVENVNGFEMQNISNKDSEQSSVHSTSNCVNTSTLWWNSTGSHIPQPSYHKNLYVKMDSLAQHANQMKHSAHQMPDQDSSSTQSTGQSHQEVSGMSEGNLHEQCVSAQSGNDTYEKHVDGQMKSVLSLGTPEVVFPPPKLDYNHSIACIPYPYPDPYFGGVLTAYGSHAIIHPQMVGMAPSSRVPLPHEQAEQEPIYVNAKQYHAILRRRQLRAKLESQNKLIKDRKPYLHESRHLHAMKRARGVGGRFLNTKKDQQESQPSKNGNAIVSSATSACSEVTSISSGGGGVGMYHQQDHLSLSYAAADFQSHIRHDGPSSGRVSSISGNGGPQHRVRR